MIRTPDLSIVIPVYNEAGNLQPLWQELKTVIERLDGVTEVIFVDDGSTDGSGDILRTLARGDGGVRVVSFAANAGLTAAFHAGYAAARAPVVVTMDADLQNDPRDVPRLLDALADADAVVGWRRHRRDRWRRRVSSRIANAVRNCVTGDFVHDSACSLRAVRRECLAAIPPYAGMHRFVPTLLRIAGFRVVEVTVHHRPRHAGVSKFGLRNRAVAALVDLMVVRWMARRALHYQVREHSESRR